MTQRPQRLYFLTWEEIRVGRSIWMRILSSGFDLISDFDLSGAARDEEFLDELSFNDMLQQNNEEMQANDSATVLHQLDACENGGTDLDESPTEDELQRPPAGHGLTGDSARRPKTGVGPIHAEVQFDVATVDINACIQNSLMSLPFAAPKSIWEDGVWAAIFGDVQACV